MHKNIFQNKIGKAFAVVAVAVMILSGSGMTWMTADAYAAVDLAQIPEYTGSPYTVINDNEPEFEADDFSTEAFENYSELDDLGRCGVAYANICQEIMPTEKRGAIGMVKPSGWHTVKYPELIKDEVSTPMRCIAPIEVVSKTERSSEKYLQELPVKGFVLEAVPLSSFEHKANEPYADRASKGLFTKPPIHWQMRPKEYFGLRFAFKARA